MSQLVAFSIVVTSVCLAIWTMTAVSTHNSGLKLLTSNSDERVLQEGSESTGDAKVVPNAAGTDGEGEKGGSLETVVADAKLSGHGTIQEGGLRENSGKKGFVSGFTGMHSYHEKERFVWNASQTPPSPGSMSCLSNFTESCTWQAGHVFFQSISNEKDLKLSQKQFEELTFLLIDGHGGPMRDTLSFLRGNGVPSKNIRSVCHHPPGYCRCVQKIKIVLVGGM